MRQLFPYRLPLTPESKKVLGGLCCLSYTSIFATHYLVAKEVLKSIDPWTLSCIRGWVGGSVLALIFWPKLKAHLSLRLLLKMAILALLGFGFNQMLFLKGLQLSTPSHAALLSNSIPVLSLLLSLLVGMERPRPLRIIGILIAFCGIAALLIYQHSLDLLTHLEGNLLILSSVLCLSSFLVLAKKYLYTLPPEAVSPLVLILGGTFFALMTRFDLAPAWHYVRMSWQNAGLMLFEVLISSSLAYYLNLLAMRFLPVSSVAAFAFLQLPLTATLGFIVYGTLPVAADFLVLGCICLGAYFIFRDERLASRLSQ